MMYAQTFAPLATMMFWLLRIRLAKLVRDWRVEFRAQAGGALSNGR